MKLLKRLVLLTVLVFLLNLFLVNAFTSDSLILNLTKNNIGAGQNFEGYLTLNLTHEIPKDSTLNFIVNGVRYSKPISEVLSTFNPPILKKSYKKLSSSNSPSKTLVFNSPGSKVEIGLDLASAGKLDSFTEDQISKFSMGFNSASIANNYPTLVMDLGNDNSIDYTYKGILTNQFEDQDSSYLADNTPDLSKGIKPFQDVFCERINVKPSINYRITARVQKIKEGATLNATLSDSPLSTMSCTDAEKCCTLNPTNQDAETSCDLPIEINEQSDQYACISASVPAENTETTVPYYNLFADSDTTKVQGYYIGQQSSTLDFFIKVKRELYETSIKQETESKDISKQGLVDYVNSPGCNDCLLIPINVTSEKAGKLILNNLVLQYESEGTTTINSFVGISSLPERINATGLSFTIPLTSFENLVTPNIGSNYELSANLDALSSNTIKFNSVPSPVVYIGLSNINPGIGEEIEFTAYGFSSGDRTASSYGWDFGDNKTANGTTVRHAYFTSGNFTIVLTTTDSAGYIGKQKVNLSVGSLSISAGSQFSKVLDSIELAKSNIESGSSQIKDTASLLGITEMLSSFKSNITLLNKSYTEIMQSSKTDLEKSVVINKINSQVAEINSKIPSNLVITVSTFSSKIGSISQIPNEVAAGNELKKKVLQAQQTVDVSGEARIVSITYPGSTDNFVLIKKVINSGSGTIYEILPSSVTIKEVLTPGYILVTPDKVFKISSVNSFLYTLDKANLADVLETRTIIVPDDIENIETSENDNVDADITQNVQIGSNTSRIIVVGITVILVLLIFYFALIFKGGLLIKKPAKIFFKNLNDYIAVKKFITYALKKKIKEADIKIALLKKGWKEDQIKAVLKEVKEEQLKFKKDAEKRAKALQKIKK